MSLTKSNVMDDDHDVAIEVDVVAIRDDLIAALAAERRECEELLDELRPKLQAAQAAVDALDEPRRVRDAIAMEVTVIQQRKAIADASLRRDIESNMPPELRVAIRDLRKQLKSRDGEAWTRCENAIAQLEKLIWQAGDLKPRIQKILHDLAEADFSAAISVG